LFVKPIEGLAKIAYQFMELIVLNKSITGLVGFISRSGLVLRNWQSGIIANYLFWMVLGIIGLVVYYLLKF
jgi:hypothetical protein